MVELSGLKSVYRRLRRWREKPPEFVREVFHVTPDPWQDDVLEAFGQTKEGGKALYDRIAMKACKNPGKTAVLAWMDWNFLATRPHPKVIATSISGPNLADGLWTEMAKWQNESEFLKAAFSWNKMSIVANDHSETWYMVARQWKQSANPEQQQKTLAGKHADYILFTIDEVGGIPRPVIMAALAALGSGIEARIIMAGNPTDLDSPLYDACTVDRDVWKLFQITGDPDHPKRAPRVSIEWAREMIRKYGRDNPFVKSDVLGEFPEKSIRNLLGPDEVQEAMDRHLPLEAYSFAQKRLGVDVARFGDDENVIFPRQGLAAFVPKVFVHERTNNIAAAVVASKVKWGSEIECVDGTGGYGAGVVDSMIQGGYAPIEVQFGGKATDPRYFNKRTEMAWDMAEWVKRGGALPNDPVLMKELTNLRYTFSSDGKIHLEEKEQIKKRLGFSPNRADALGLTFALPEMPAATVTLDNGRQVHLPALGRGGGASTEYEHHYDPYSNDRI